MQSVKKSFSFYFIFIIFATHFFIIIIINTTFSITFITVPQGDDCGTDYCGPNSGCRIIGGNPICFCLPEYIGNPPVEPCKPPLDPCQPSPCGPNTECNIVNGYHRCTCKAGYVGSPNTIRGCNLPINPCAPNPCGPGALCDPGVLHFCYCRPGLVGDPFTGCEGNILFNIIQVCFSFIEIIYISNDIFICA